MRNGIVGYRYLLFIYVIYFIHNKKILVMEPDVRVLISVPRGEVPPLPPLPPMEPIRGGCVTSGTLGDVDEIALSTMRNSYRVLASGTSSSGEQRTAVDALCGNFEKNATRRAGAMLEIGLIPQLIQVLHQKEPVPKKCALGGKTLHSQTLNVLCYACFAHTPSSVEVYRANGIVRILELTQSSWILTMQRAMECLYSVLPRNTKDAFYLEYCLKCGAADFVGRTLTKVLYQLVDSGDLRSVFRKEVDMKPFGKLLCRRAGATLEYSESLPTYSYKQLINMLLPLDTLCKCYPFPSYELLRPLMRPSLLWMAVLMRSHATIFRESIEYLSSGLTCLMRARVHDSPAPSYRSMLSVIMEMLEYPNKVVSLEAAQIIGLLSSGTQQHKREIVDAGGLRRILCILKCPHNKVHPMLIYECMWTVSNLCLESTRAVVEAGFLPVIVNLLQCDRESIKYVAIRIVVRVAARGVRAFTDELVSLGTLSLLCACVHTTTVPTLEGLYSILAVGTGPVSPYVATLRVDDVSMKSLRGCDHEIARQLLRHIDGES